MIIYSSSSLIQNISCKSLYISNKFIRNIKSIIYSYVYLCIHINISCSGKNNTVNQFKFSQHLLELTLRVIRKSINIREYTFLHIHGCNRQLTVITCQFQLLALVIVRYIITNISCFVLHCTHILFNVKYRLQETHAKLECQREAYLNVREDSNLIKSIWYYR